MTLENYDYRTSPFLLRNQFPGEGKLQIPVVPKFQIYNDDFDDLRFIGFDRTNLENSKHRDRMVHFFLYDYKFERVWKTPEADLEKLRQYRAVLTPDFSMYLEMSPVMKLYNVFRNRWCGAFGASKGLRVIPTVSWGGEDTFEYCFDGIEKGSTVAVSTYMATAHGNHSDQKDFFLKGYRELLRRIEPETILCYNKPFPEMEGNIVYIDYDLSSWRHMDDEPQAASPYAKYICGAEPMPNNCHLTIKGGCVLRDKGIGSAYGGDWKPAKEDDERFLGEPREIKRTQSIGRRGGYSRDTKIGENGRAERGRHYTDHNCPGKHSSPHDHEIDWSKGFPDPGNPINYPEGTPEFKGYERLTIRSQA